MDNIGIPPSIMAKEKEKSDCGCGGSKEGGNCKCKKKIKPMEILLVIAILGGEYYLIKK